MLTTPTEIGESVEALQTRFSLGPAEWVPVEPRSDSFSGDCYGDVERQIKARGGEIVYGWMVWEWPRMLIEGEFHAVWRSPEGRIADVTFKGEGEKTILFIPDPARSYQGERVTTYGWRYGTMH